MSVRSAVACVSADVEVPEDVAIQQKLAGKKTFSVNLFGSADDKAAHQARQEAESQPEWWQSEDGTLPHLFCRTCVGGHPKARACWT